jgi:predicted secreted protein
MKWCRAFSLALAGMLLSLNACSPGPRVEIIEVQCERFSGEPGEQVVLIQTVTLNRGDSIVLRLCSNPSTGFMWEDAVISAPSVLAERSRVFIEPGPTMPGGAGLEQWTFEAIGRGECNVTLGYSRPWDGGEKDVWRFELDTRVA